MQGGLQGRVQHLTMSYVRGRGAHACKRLRQNKRGLHTQGRTAPSPAPPHLNEHRRPDADGVLQRSQEGAVTELDHAQPIVALHLLQPGVGLRGRRVIVASKLGIRAHAAMDEQVEHANEGARGSLLPKPSPCLWACRLGMMPGSAAV